MVKSNAQRLAEASAAPFIPKAVAAIMRDAAKELLHCALDMGEISDEELAAMPRCEDGVSGQIAAWAQTPSTDPEPVPEGTPVPFHSDLRSRVVPEVPRWMSDLGALPGLYIKPTIRGEIDVEVWLPCGYNSFAPKSIIIGEADLLALFADYSAWPEAAIAKWFSTTLPLRGAVRRTAGTSLEMGPKAKAAPGAPRRKISLADLDLQ